MSEILGFALAANHDGRLEVVAITADPAGFGGDVWHAWQTAPNGSWTSWHPFGRPGRGASVPVIARNADGRLEVVVVGGDQALWHRSQTAPDNGWSDWQSIGQPDAQSPMFLVLAQNADGRLEAAVSASDDFGGRAIWHAWQTAPSNGWSGWASLGAPPDDFSGPLVLGANADGRLEVFAPEAFAGGDQEVWHRWQRAPGGQWVAWSSLGSPGGELLPDPPPVLGQNADGRLELFVLAGDGVVWHRWQTAPNMAGRPGRRLAARGAGSPTWVLAGMPTAGWSCSPPCSTAATCGAAARPPPTAVGCRGRTGAGWPRGRFRARHWPRLLMDDSCCSCGPQAMGGCIS